MDSLYSALGGEDFFRRLVSGFYAQVKTDDLIGPMYPDDDWDGAEDRLRWFLAQYWGGPPTFNEQRGAPMLRRRHFPFRIGMAEAERWLELMSNSLDQFSEDELNPAQREALWNHMQRVAYMMINQPGEHPGMR
ncbi:globin [Corynebacterium genitalium ATCC 33030]|uniref:Protozoan/cyanobacterial globin family protein n=1 Tax=Corynebacterium genitalium ATCC 33030 TaxID=585529 RepID=D7WC24_9CORY|nr:MULTISPECIES: globin [Corynebacterium]MCQ4618479.1 globin [Corynebacterium pseudogenitalium]EFK54653.1 protozoan/cyanobacterial globin family protein [Corynebacterium genitalium ATCC 33030]MCQ4625644.1 globin [Corynebacterium sp. CCUG 69979]MCQ4628267.1 globin [Corynebacterium sp. CCUG 65737]UUA89022.1 globin [Corynebacterium genitalium ATCC 33030]